jgi:hypothetical protein
VEKKVKAQTWKPPRVRRKDCPAFGNSRQSFEPFKYRLLFSMVLVPLTLSIFRYGAQTFWLIFENGRLDAALKTFSAGRYLTNGTTRILKEPLRLLNLFPGHVISSGLKSHSVTVVLSAFGAVS